MSVRLSVIRLTDIYSFRELNDEEEPISNVAFQDDDEQDYLFVIQTMTAAETTGLMTHAGDMTVVEAFDAFAEPWQKRLVREKTRNFDEDRIIVIESRVDEEGRDIRCVIDGNHHVIAAAKADRDIQFIDVSSRVTLEKFSDLAALQADDSPSP